MVIAVLVAIGCGDPSTSLGAPSRAESRDGGGKPPIQVAQATTTASGSTAAQPATGGSASIRGTIRFEGSAPQPVKIKMDADPVCQQQHTSPVYSEEVVVNPNGTLKHVFVYVKEGVKGTFPAPATPVTLNQTGCGYTPHVLGIQAGQPLEIVNSDPTLHNVNAKPTANQPFNVAQPVKGMKTKKSFAKPELGVKFKCNVHPWMSAYALVVEHPFFAVSDDAGSFAIAGLPTGTYVLEAWHEKYGTQTQTVSVSDGDTAAVTFTFTGE
jgi:plastocyanin